MGMLLSGVAGGPSVVHVFMLLIVWFVGVSLCSRHSTICSTRMVVMHLLLLLQTIHKMHTTTFNQLHLAYPAYTWRIAQYPTGG
jgi:hypothetical protein